MIYHSIIWVHFLVTATLYCRFLIFSLLFNTLIFLYICLVCFPKLSYPKILHLYVCLITNPINFKLMTSIRILTTVSLIWTVPAVVISVTTPGMRDAAVVGTGKLVCRTCSRYPCRTVLFITVIKTVIVPITAPSWRHTVLVGTGECSRGTSSIWKKDDEFLNTS